MRQRPVITSVVMLVAVIVVGISFQGLTFVTDPLPVPDKLAQLWAIFNGMFMVITACLTYRRMRTGEHWLTVQETWVLRGIIWYLIGGSLGYLSRLVSQDARVSLGTPGVTLGVLCVAYAMLGTSQRRESERALENAVFQMEKLDLPTPYEVRKYLEKRREEDGDGSS